MLARHAEKFSEDRLFITVIWFKGVHSQNDVNGGGFKRDAVQPRGEDLRIANSFRNKMLSCEQQP